ncbi:hypothetical protein [Verrucomicrobium spinosum]|uniref:hypothetical protein n=1 Tax=Verrucomicrobium spinosum TaxID=2736 RepID=UPI000B0F6451|nr:hypothetical protein [Verrucomicrobium spinosum]
MSQPLQILHHHAGTPSSRAKLGPYEIESSSPWLTKEPAPPTASVLSPIRPPA